MELRWRTKAQHRGTETKRLWLERCDWKTGSHQTIHSDVGLVIPKHMWINIKLSVLVLENWVDVWWGKTPVFVLWSNIECGVGSDVIVNGSKPCKKPNQSGLAKWHVVFGVQIMKGFTKQMMKSWTPGIKSVRDKEDYQQHYLRSLCENLVCSCPEVQNKEENLFPGYGVIYFTVTNSAPPTSRRLMIGGKT